MQAIQALEMITMELDMLAKAPPPSSEPHPAQAQEDDARRRGHKVDPYNEKLDAIPSSIKGGNLLSKDGKPLRPFVLLDKRQQLKDGVFGPGHNLPTMTIDEYLEEERRRGGIVEGGGFVLRFHVICSILTVCREKSGERLEVDEDDYEAADRATMKARAWDEYIEQNPKYAAPHLYDTRI